MPEVSFPFLLQSNQLAQAIRNNSSELVAVNLKGEAQLQFQSSEASSYPTIVAINLLLELDWLMSEIEGS